MYDKINLGLTMQSAHLSLGELISEQTLKTPSQIALKDCEKTYTYYEFDRRTSQFAQFLQDQGLQRGDRVAVLSENSSEYVELLVAGAKIGLIIACQNWRLAKPELAHCISLVAPKILFTSKRYAQKAEQLQLPLKTYILDKALSKKYAPYSDVAPEDQITPEDGAVILYTSGTTGLPKGALISHRAQIARAQIQMSDLPAAPEDVFVAWAPLFHMVSTDTVFKTLMIGGTVHVTDGFKPEELAQIIAKEQLGRLTLMPGMISPLIEAVRNNRSRVRGIKWIGVMADLVPLDQIAEITTLLNAPYLNTFGATETGFAPASAGTIAVGEIAQSLNKKQSSLCKIKLVDDQDREVPDGEPGELAIRSPALFSGYWNNPEANAKDFRGGWFHMGDIFNRNPDGTLSFVDRRKYLIKSGGENIYPAELERIILSDPRVIEAAVVRQKDAEWGEVPIAFIARKEDSLDVSAVEDLLMGKIARYKRPKSIHFIAEADFPRSTTGKIMRHLLEDRLKSAIGESINDDDAS